MLRLTRFVSVYILWSISWFKLYSKYKKSVTMLIEVLNMHWASFILSSFIPESWLRLRGFDFITWNRQTNPERKNFIFYLALTSQRSSMPIGNILTAQRSGNTRIRDLEQQWHNQGPKTVTQPGTKNSETTRGQREWHNQGPSTVTQAGARKSDTTRGQQQGNNQVLATVTQPGASNRETNRGYQQWHNHGPTTYSDTTRGQQQRHNQDPKTMAQPRG